MLPALKKRQGFPSIVDEFFGRDLFPGLFFESEKWPTVPAVNIVDGKDDYRIEVAAPGLDKKDFNIDIDNNVLTVSSEKEERSEENEDRFMRREFSYTSFKRSFALPESADADKISAKHKDGVLSVIIPKKDEAKERPPRQIKVS